MARGMNSVGKYHNGSRGKRKHVLIAQKALGKELPITAVVHHIDGDRGNNTNTNLLICPNEAYHNLIHLRSEALEKCGNADWRRCKFCKEFDDPIMMAEWCKPRPNPGYYHRKCHANYERDRLAKRRTQN